MAEHAQPLAGEPVARVAVCGASGFAGALAARLVWNHPRLELVAATAREDAGTRLDRLYPRHRVPVELTALDPETIDCDVALVAYPHTAASVVDQAFRARGITVIDLSADYRLRDLGTYEQWYGPHSAPELLPEAAYGLPELYRAQIAGSKLIACPGCYPTATVLALAPLAAEGLIGDLVVDAKSGVSGAGRGGGDRLAFATVDENVSPYGTGGHRHQPEIEQELAALSGGEPPPLTFVPHLLPLDQGELVSCYVELTSELSSAAIEDLYSERYDDEPFVELVDAPPGVRDARETNLCLIHVAPAPPSGRVPVFAAIDNLWKGAAGQAIQNLNIVLGLDEGEGLR